MRARVWVFWVALAVVAVPVCTAAVPVVIHVNDDAAPGGDGSGRRPYKNLPEAVAAARAASGEVVVKVQPGAYALGETLVIDRSLGLRGSTEQVASGDAWPSGEATVGTETRVYSTNPSMTQLIVVGRPDASVLENVTIRGFALDGPAAGIGVSVRVNRTQGFRIADNVFRGPAAFAFQSTASSGHVTGNHFSGVGTGAVFTGGYPESPSNVVASGNRSVRNNLGGMLLNGASVDIPELGDLLNAVIRDNDLSDNTANASQSFGLRIFIIRRDLGLDGDEQSSANVQALVQNNRIHGNRFGVVLDAGFPYRSVDGVCDSRVYSGTIDAQLLGNTVTGSLVTPALVTSTRSVAALNVSQLPQFQYLHGATFAILDQDESLAGARIDHPAVDPYLGPCPGDSTNEPLDNVLTYNGVALPNGKNF